MYHKDPMVVSDPFLRALSSYHGYWLESPKFKFLSAEKKSEQDHFSLLRYFNFSGTNPEKVAQNCYPFLAPLWFAHSDRLFVRIFLDQITHCWSNAKGYNRTVLWTNGKERRREDEGTLQTMKGQSGAAVTKYEITSIRSELNIF